MSSHCVQFNIIQVISRCLCARNILLNRKIRKNNFFLQSFNIIVVVCANDFLQFQWRHPSWRTRRCMEGAATILLPVPLTALLPTTRSTLAPPPPIPLMSTVSPHLPGPIISLPNHINHTQSIIIILSVFL